MKTTKRAAFHITILFLGITISGFAQNLGEIAFRNESKSVISDTQDELAIKNVIEKETEAWFARDAAKMESCWAKVPQITQCVSLLGDVVIFNTAESTKGKDPFAMVGTVPQKATITRTDWNFRIVGNGAYVTYTEKDESGGLTSHFYESRFMEKMDGAWKIVAVNATAYKP